MTRSHLDDVAERTFTTPPERRGRMTEVVLRHESATRALRVLDIGCATGMQVLDLARALPAAHLVGVDISPPSIRAAEDAARRSPDGGRVTFVASDYWRFEDGPFDVLVAGPSLGTRAGREVVGEF